MSNTQVPTKLDTAGTSLAVHSIWPTIQGEGPFAGRNAVFIRLNGCNLQCPFCDTEYTAPSTVYLNEADDKGSPNLNDILKQVHNLTPIRNAHLIATRPLVVITGGEPFRQNLKPLTDLLHFSGFTVQIETNGTIFQELHDRIVIVCSPKTPRISVELARRANCFKYVLDAEHVNPRDGLPSGTMGNYGQPARPPLGWEGEIYVQPLDEDVAHPEDSPVTTLRNEMHRQACVRAVCNYGYRLCLQMHKIVHVQ